MITLRKPFTMDSLFNSSTLIVSLCANMLHCNACLMIFCSQGPVGVAGLKGGRGTQGAPVSLSKSLFHKCRKMLLFCIVLSFFSPKRFNLKTLSLPPGPHWFSWICWKSRPTRPPCEYSQELVIKLKEVRSLKFIIEVFVKENRC